MSSLSQEDLDAGWDETDVAQPAQVMPEAAGTVPHASTPPNSMIIETTPVPLESLIVRSPPPADSEPPRIDEAADSLTGQQDAAVAESAIADPVAQSSESTASDSQSVAPSSEQEAPSSERRVRSADIVAGPAPIDVEVSLPPTGGGQAEPEPAHSESVPAASGESATSGLTAQTDSNQEPFAAVAEKPQLLAQRGVALPLEPATASESAIETAQSKETAPSNEHGPTTAEQAQAPQVLQQHSGVRDARIESQPPSDSAIEEQLIVELEPIQPTQSFFIARWRMIAVASTALLALIVGLLLIRSKHQTRLEEERSRAANVVPVQQGLPAVAHGAEATPKVAAATAASGAVPEATPASDNNTQRESFSEAFVKHAASVNSNWAEVKKRSKVSEPNQSVRSAASGNPSNTTPAANPLDVLDKLEKARKAKKTGGS